MNFDFYLILNMKVNFKQIVDLNVKGKIIKILEENKRMFL